MKYRYFIYVSAAFVIGYLILKNPRPYQLAANKFVEWFSKSFSVFGRVAK
jgi:hypothetical protein